MPALFEDFSPDPLDFNAEPVTTDTALEHYEKGYKAGWDDASKAHGQSATHVSGVLGRNIEAIEFTLVEARAMVLDALKPVLNEVAQTLFPALSSEAMRSTLLSELASLLDAAASKTVQLDVSKSDVDAVTALLEAEALSDKVALNVRETLGEGQIYVALDQTELRVDIPNALEDITNALAAFDPNATQPDLDHAHAG